MKTKTRISSCQWWNYNANWIQFQGVSTVKVRALIGGKIKKKWILKFGMGHVEISWQSSDTAAQNSDNLLPLPITRRLSISSRSSSPSLIWDWSCIAWGCIFAKQGSLRLFLFKFSWVHSFSHDQLFVTPWIAEHQASMSFTISWSWLKLMSIQSMMPSNHLILCHPLLLLSSVFSSIRVFSNWLAFLISWSKYRSFSFSISPSN